MLYYRRCFLFHWFRVCMLQPRPMPFICVSCLSFKTYKYTIHIHLHVRPHRYIHSNKHTLLIFDVCICYTHTLTHTTAHVHSLEQTHTFDLRPALLLKTRAFTSMNM